ncbi:MAG TPA: ATP-binding protein [Gemmatimonadaceae bacterium]|nr:ATP-binding protein [Gemmatimonadaceae bacterium]
MPAGRSITLRLPLLILALLSLVIVALGWSSYRHLTAALEQAAGDRLSGASAQIVGLLQTSLAQVRSEAVAIATDAVVVRAVERRDAGSLAAARPILSRQTAARERLVRTLWSRECEPVLTVGEGVPRSAERDCPTSRARPLPVERSGGAGGWVQPFVVQGDTVSYDVIAPVLSASGDTIGYLQTTRRLRANESGKVVGRLIGRDVAFMLGNASGPAVWTDLTRRVDGPSLPANHRARFEWLDATATRQFGVSRDVPFAPWTVWVQQPYAHVVQPALQSLRDLGAIALTALLLAVTGAWLVSRHVTAPLVDLTDAAGDIAQGNYRRRVRSDRRDELGVLVQAFNRMAAEVEHAHAELQDQAVELEQHAQQAQDLAHELELSNQELSETLEEATKARHEITLAESEKKALEAQFLQAQKMEAVGRLAGGIAHDFNNLLTVIASYSSMALESLRVDDPLHADMKEIRGAAERAARLTRQLLAFSRKQVMRPEMLDLTSMARDMERMLQRLIGEDVTLELKLEPELGIICADPGQVEQVIMNLVVNARDAMPNGGHLVIETSNVAFSTELSMTELGRPAGEYVLLSVTDTGTGMSEATQANLFEPFFTTKGAGVGTGLGLSTVYGIVKQSGGDIHVRSELGRGTSFRIYFPRAEEREMRHTREMPVPRVSLAGTETILLVEDDASLRQLTARVLRDAGYEVLAPMTPTEAVLAGTHHEGTVDLLLTDVVMPQMTGRTVAELLVQQKPGLKVLYMSGYTDDDVVRRGVLATDTEFLQKPFTPTELLRQVRAVLDGRMDTSGPATTRQ